MHIKYKNSFFKEWCTRAGCGHGRCTRAGVGHGRCTRAGVGHGRCTRAGVGHGRGVVLAHGPFFFGHSHRGFTGNWQIDDETCLLYPGHGATGYVRQLH